MVKIIKCVIIFCLTALISSCSKEEKESSVAMISETQEKDVLVRIQELGFSAEDIEEFADYFIVEGDIAFAKTINKKENSKQTSTNRLAVNGNFNVWLNSNFTQLNGNMSLALDAVITDYNSLPSALNFTRVANSNDADIIIYNSNTPGSSCAHAYFPSSSGKPGSSIAINEARILTHQGGQVNMLRRTLAHELGHTIGLRHTDWIENGEPVSNFGANLIPNTTHDDVNSVMNIIVCYMNWTGFSNDDVVAIINLYPNFTWSTAATAGIYAEPQSNIALSNSNKLYYVRQDNIIGVTYPNGSSWSNAYFPSFYPAGEGTDLLWDNESNGLFYTDQYGNLGRIYYSSGWYYESPNGFQASLNGGLTMDQDSRLFFLKNNGTLASTKKINGSWISTLHNALPTAFPESDLAYDLVTQSVFYVASNNSTICRAIKTGSVWNTYEYTAGNNAAPNSSIAQDQYGKTYYIKENGVLSVTWKEGGTWTSHNFNNFPKASLNSSLVWNPTRNELYYVTDPQELIRVFYENGTWSYNKISRKIKELAVNKLTYNNDHVYYLQGAVLYDLYLDR